MEHFGIWVNPEIRERLKEWWSVGLSASLISDKYKTFGIDLTKNAIIGKVHRMGLQRNDVARQQKRPPIRKIKPKAALDAHTPLCRKSKDLPIVGGIKMTNPDPSKRVLLTQTKDGQCRAIVGYVDGALAKAVCCGEDAPKRIRGSRVVHSSWCPHHHNIYTTKGKYESSRAS